MSAHKHTSGRTVEHRRGEYVVLGDETENGAVLGTFHYARGVEAAREQAEELAHELASAPDLYAALEACIPALYLLGDYIGNEWRGSTGHPPFDRCALILAAKDALAKARGEA